MSDNPLLGIVYQQLKGDHVYEVMFPKNIREGYVGKAAKLYLFSANRRGQSNGSSLSISLTAPLCATTDIPLRNVIAMRLAYDCLGSDDKEHGAGIGDMDQILNESQTDRNFLRYEILKYATQRYEEVFEKEFLVMEFVAAISANPSEIIRQLTYFHSQGMIAFPVTHQHILEQQDYLDILSWPMDFNSEMKSEALELVSQYEEGMAESTSNDGESTITKIFLSYSTYDKKLVGKIKDCLYGYGLDVFLAHEDIDPSDEWQETILENLKKCDAFIPVLTDKFRDSKWTDQESGMALNLDKVIVPIMFTENPHGFLEKIQAVRINADDIETTCSEIVDALKKKLPSLAETTT